MAPATTGKSARRGDSVCTRHMMTAMMNPLLNSIAPLADLRRGLQRDEPNQPRHAEPLVNTPLFGTITEAATPGREMQPSARLPF